MVEIISVRFNNGGKPYYFNPAGIAFEIDDGVIVETSKGMEYGTCVSANTLIDEMELFAPLRPVIRKADDLDRAAMRAMKEKEAIALETCRKKIQEHKLDMKLVAAEYNFEGNKVTFLFTADGRVDFRSLVKDLAITLHARIELRQIGVRDEARMIGGLGICGRPFCCNSCLEEFQPVSIKMAKTQNLSLNPTKISGTCGRLMCCLKYEQDAYEDLMSSAPKLESFVETPDGAGNVVSVNLLRQTVQVRLESDPDTPRTYRNSELNIVRSGKGKRPDGYVEPPREELEKLRAHEEPRVEENEWATDEEETEEAVPAQGNPQRRGRNQNRRRNSSGKPVLQMQKPGEGGAEGPQVQKQAEGGQPRGDKSQKKPQGGAQTRQRQPQKNQAQQGQQGQQASKGQGQQTQKPQGDRRPNRPKLQMQTPKAPKGEGETPEKAEPRPQKAESPEGEGGKTFSAHRRHRRYSRGGYRPQGQTPPAGPAPGPEG